MSLNQNKMDRIITFGCRSRVFVYQENCGWIPRKPYKVHNSINSAIKHLKDRGVVSPEIKVYHTLEFRNNGQVVRSA